MKTLQAQVKALTVQVAALKARVAEGEKQTAYVRDYAQCSAAWDADAFQNLYGVVDVLTNHLIGKPYYGQQTRVDDKGACSRIGVTRSLVWNSTYRFATSLAFGTSS